VIPAMGYSRHQVADLEATINATPADSVLVGTPIDLGSLIECNKPLVRVRYDLAPLGGVDLGSLVLERLPLSPAPA